MPEELALQQRGRNRRAVQGNETVLTAAAGLVNRLGDHFLAGTSLALNQDGGVHRRNYIYLVLQSPEFRTVPNQI
jgi:hypothetical protein